MERFIAINTYVRTARNSTLWACWTLRKELIDENRKEWSLISGNAYAAIEHGISLKHSTPFIDNEKRSKGAITFDEFYYVHAFSVSNLSSTRSLNGFNYDLSFRSFTRNCFLSATKVNCQSVIYPRVKIQFEITLNSGMDNHEV